MKTQLKVLPIKDIKIDEKTYPRLHTDFVTISRYINSMKSGSEFPPIVVARFKNKYYLVDGRHRIESNKALKQKHIQTEVLTGLDEKQIYIEAVKRNISHGRQFSTQEVVDICINLEDWNMSQEAISEIVRIPATQITPFVAKRSTRITETEETIALKSSLRHFVDTDVNGSFEEKQRLLTPSRNQETLITNLILLIENDWVNRDNKTVAKKLNKLYKLLSTYV